MAYCSETQSHHTGKRRHWGTTHELVILHNREEASCKNASLERNYTQLKTIRSPGGYYQQLLVKQDGRENKEATDEIPEKADSREESARQGTQQQIAKQTFTVILLLL